MKHRSETVTATNGASVELATIEHEGHSFTNMGAVIDLERGIIVAYPHHGNFNGIPHTLRTWDGKSIAALEITGKARGFYGSELTCYAMTYAGKRWHGRGLGNSMVVTMRAGRDATPKENANR